MIKILLYAIIAISLLATITYADDSANLKSDKNFDDLTSNASMAKQMADQFIATDVPPELIEMPTPVYPEKARKNNVEAKMYINAYVDTDGHVAEAKILKMPEEARNMGFEEAALAAAKKAVYKPAMKDDKPVAVWIAFQIYFKLDNCEKSE